MSLSLKATAAAVIATLGLAGASLAAMPVTPVTPMLGADFKLDFGITAETLERGKKLQEDMILMGYDSDEIDDWCLSKNQIRNGMVRARFDDIDFTTRLTQSRVRVEALYEADGWVYSMIVDKCSGEVTMLAPIYSAAEID